ncbi:PROBABLE TRANSMEMBRANE PROTEIN [Brachybacterium faecium]|uniref:General stress protein 17M-like domain-containing protein n=1 Tax=Brachybacterium faecium (strain ATCC 43885 / DSM 4810 / JCM 11609 / LMG 19847 / NBRC 14762 / NCIMB 9860 / 6-10) TaxID=446465 RepID=C7MFG1_BRAFD|nr:general stress protein [Brachybacterium faecium]ACU86178.1 hypothetical protein Bfae_23860 [Brachybacterium faecium DSM 4810]SLM94865.1 PROBABLE TRANSMEMBRANE PROTEIN [Brachybacterium faecium]HJG52086.1 hypothetical protein [Brachybacterium faecium]
MSQPPQSPRSASPLTARLYDLEYPRSLGVYSTYQEVQSVVDTLADRQFPVQSTLIVGTDLKLMERVTGRKTWPRVISQGVLSGLWMGLFMGLLLWFLNPSNLMIIIPSIVLGIVFFTVWSVIGYAMTGGRRDFTSMTATIPMQYELLVEHKHAEQARQILAESGAAPAPVRSPAVGGAPRPGQHGAPGQQAMPGQQAAPGQQTMPGQQVSPGQQAAPGYGVQQPGAPGARPGGSTLSAPSPAGSSAAPSRPNYGQPAPSTPTPTAPGRAGRPSFGKPAGAPLHEETSGAPRPQGSRSFGEAGSMEPSDPAEGQSPQAPSSGNPSEEQRPQDPQSGSSSER